jgi:N-formylglutamate amidohydrolase
LRRRLHAFVAGVARGLGYQVAINDPFKGAELVARFGRPDDGKHSLQVEINLCALHGRGPH